MRKRCRAALATAVQKLTDVAASRQGVQTGTEFRWRLSPESRYAETDWSLSPQFAIRNLKLSGLLFRFSFWDGRLGGARASRVRVRASRPNLCWTNQLVDGFSARRRNRQPGRSRTPFHNLPHCIAFKKRLAKLAGSGSIGASVKKPNNMSAANIVCIVALCNLICWSAVAQNDAGGLSFYGPHAAENATAARPRNKLPHSCPQQAAAMRAQQAAMLNNQQEEKDRQAIINDVYTRYPRPIETTADGRPTGAYRIFEGQLYRVYGDFTSPRFEWVPPIQLGSNSKILS